MSSAAEYSSLHQWTLVAGSAFPLGANVVEGGVNFSLFSANATKVVLCLFDAQHNEVAQFSLSAKTRHIWHGCILGVSAGQRYGYRVYGPYQPELGHRFNHHKLLLDPYAKQFDGELVHHEAIYGYRSRTVKADLSFSELDSAPYMPKCVVVDTAPLKDIIIKPIKRSLAKSIIYETHVKGFTQTCPNVPELKRGKFAALGEPAIIQYLTELGITAIELLPVQAFADEPFLIEKGLNNYWGYNTLGFFAPHPSYLSQADIAEFRHAVSALHQAGIEVILDVVYNHTAEGNELGPTYNFRGIDNASYYRLMPNEPRKYINDTGCGNTLNINHPQVLMMVMDSLRYWIEVMGVDGFRFDLASCLGREAYGFDPGSGFFDALMQDPVLCQVKLIAEPWDIGPGGYQLGNYPIGFSEWNDRYRDVMRRFWRGDDAMLSDFAKSFHGSSDVFEHGGRGPSASINFITSHDGFTLRDLVSYQHKHNQANGEQNRDGHQENFSCNYGVEGDTSDSTINQVRQRQQRNLLTTLLLSQGVPMLLAGDEVGQTQKGNNNAYCQDNPNGWFDWQACDDGLLAFTKALIALRKRFPMLCHQQFIHQPHAELDNGMVWFNRQGDPMSKAAWSEYHCKTLAVMICGDLAEQGSMPTPCNAQAILILLNADNCQQDFQLPQLAHFEHWQRVLDTQEDTPWQGEFELFSTPKHLVTSASIAASAADSQQIDTANRKTRYLPSDSTASHYQLQAHSLMIFHSHFSRRES
ncbi:glycogen debranching enzyme GlgX [Shewanella maritima]|uniref:Glycogen debranching enzyme GlgX n=1 Tax=Shewanella maritima TaxID=2520507 RepID=A0A411PKI4_9GAMM|nr:glycogen debranching protein GlgX [Shewanella maritima]QBF84026.1 glycogen debranching enzyme GlgX [Shewanella maritima]